MAPFAAALSLHGPSAPSLFSGHSTLVASHPRPATLRFLAPPAGTAVIRCAASSLDSSKGAAVLEKPSNPTKTGNWRWNFQEYSANIYYEEYGEKGNENTKTILMIPTISDVSTVEEWRVVAKDIVAREGKTSWHAILVDWPGLGYSDRPSINYNADVMENFLVQLLSAPNSPLRNSGNEPIIFAGGHAATITLRAAKKGLVKPSAIASVAPTWAGPLPIVFGRDSKMESRYGLLRGTLRTPAVGWMMYNVLVSNEKAIQSQYTSHVYANPDNVTPDIVQSRYALTKRKGARYVPAAFLTGQLDPVKSREKFLDLFAHLEGRVPVLVVSTANAPKRSKAEMEALKGAKGVTKFVEVPGALLPQEEFPLAVAGELYQFLKIADSSMWDLSAGSYQIAARSFLYVARGNRFTLAFCIITQR